MIAQYHSRRLWQGRIAPGSILATVVAAMILRRSRTARRQPPSADSAGGLPASPGRAIGSRRRGEAPRRKAIAQNITILYRALGRAMCGPRRKACNWPAHRVGGPIIQNTCFARLRLGCGSAKLRLPQPDCEQQGWAGRLSRPLRAAHGLRGWAN